MRRQRDIRLAISIFLAMAVALLLPCSSNAGSLEPSDPPSPTMRTLDEIYSTNSWSKKLPCDSTTNCPRFEVLADFNNEAVLDRETGLVWRRSPWNYQMNWWNAKNTCLAGCLDGRCGWRVPTIYELQSLVGDYNPDCHPHFLPCGHPFTNATYCWWSSTDSPFDFNEAVYFCSQTGWSYSEKTGEYFGSWCVRGGLGVDDSITYHY